MNRFLKLLCAVLLSASPSVAQTISADAVFLPPRRIIFGDPGTPYAVYLGQSGPNEVTLNGNLKITGTCIIGCGTIATPSVPGTVAPRDNLTVDASGNLDYTPLDYSTFSSPGFEFCDASPFPFNTTNIGGAPVFATGASTTTNICTLKVSTTAVSGQGGILSWGSSTTGGMGNIFTISSPWEIGWVFGINPVATIQARIGMVLMSAATAIPTSGAFMRFDTTLGTPDTHWMFCVDVASAETCLDTGITPVATGVGIPAANSMIRLRLRLITASKIGFTLYDNAGVQTVAEKTSCSAGCDITIASFSGLINVVPGFDLATATSAAGSIYVDTFRMKMRGIAR